MKKYCLWKDEEVIKLFRHIEGCIDNGTCLTTAFKSYADLSGRKSNSVRNYYYAELLHLEENEDRRKAFNIDLSKHQKITPKYFSPEETQTQIEEILKLYNKGYSIRKACFEIAKGNLDEMVRLQNKYRTVLKNQPAIITEIEKKLQNTGLTLKEKKLPANILSMPTRKTRLTDNEINSLFLGLVRLIKNNTKIELSALTQKQTQMANQQLRLMMVNLSEKDKEIQNLRKKFELLRSENEIFEKKIQELRSENAKLLDSKINSKIKTLKEFATKNNKHKKLGNN